jgi:hypothetical protein
MTWTRLDDNWLADEAFDGLDVPTIFHYLNMIQFCSRGKRYTGLVPLVHARTCSIVDDPTAAIAALIKAELLENVDGATLRVVRIEEHIPPPSVREASAATAVRVARHRKHKNGDHSDCLPEKCSKATGNGPTDRGNALHQDKDGDGKGRAVTGSTPAPPLTSEERALLAEHDAQQGYHPNDPDLRREAS